MLVGSLRDFGQEDVGVAGGKGANLGELIRAGFPVPDGFIVTTAAKSTMDDRLRAEILHAYARLSDGAGPATVAVRSSATAEDLPGAAFAGQQDTFLDITGADALLDAVERCWASLWTERAQAYRARLGIADDEVAIAVVVQEMVPADFAGVMFTADPVTGARDRTVIDANPGLGEAVVSGMVTPDHYVLDARGRIMQRRTGRREVVLRSTGSTGVGPQNLPDETIRELAGLGAQVQRHFGRPQDIEWAVAGGRISLVQARPMTALPPPPPARRLSPLQRRIGSVLIEYLPVRPYPIDMSTWMPYGPAGLMAKVVGYFGLRGAFDDFVVEQDGVVTALRPPRPRATLGVLRAPWRIATLAARYDPAKWTDDVLFRQFLQRVRQLEQVDLQTLGWPELVRMPRTSLELVAPITDLRIRYLPRTALSIVGYCSASR